jgi:hypothetical protein
MISTRFHNSAAEAALKSTSHAPILGFAAKKPKRKRFPGDLVDTGKIISKSSWF